MNGNNMTFILTGHALEKHGYLSYQMNIFFCICNKLCVEAYEVDNGKRAQSDDS